MAENRAYAETYMCNASFPDPFAEYQRRLSLYLSEIKIFNSC